MSGGHFNYQQYQLESIADAIEQLISSNNDESLNEWGDTVGRHYGAETIKEFQEAVLLLRKAQIYAQRIDWLVSCDDSEEQFHKRLAAELAELSEKIPVSPANQQKFERLRD